MKPNHVVFKIPYENPNELKSVVRDRTKQGNDDGCAAVEPDKNRGAHDIMRKESALKIINDFADILRKKSAFRFGYPVNLDFDYDGLEQLNAFSINNAGDAFNFTGNALDSRPFEVGVLQWFARLFEIETDDFWGYVTTGGSESNLQSIYTGRELFPDGILYFSSSAHYSVSKIAKLCRMEYEQIPSLENGEIDCNLLKSSLVKNSGHPAILNVTVGTTFKGAIDNLDKIFEVLSEAGYTEDRFYIHVDGALNGIMIPFLDGPDVPTLTFKKPIDSIAISGHKFLGCPFPCSVLITRRQKLKVEAPIEYIFSRDTTISCSRSGHTPIYLWYRIFQKEFVGIKKDVDQCLKNAKWLKFQFDRMNIPAFCNAFSNVVFFARPHDGSIIHKWQLAAEGEQAHVVVMPHVTIDKLKCFVSDIEKLQKEQRYYDA